MAFRKNYIAAEMDLLGRSFKAQFKSADSSGTHFACIIGPEEVKARVVSVKDLTTGKQESVNEDSIVSYLKAFFEGKH
jgi:histidyl-tRNA synthetase